MPDTVALLDFWPEYFFSAALLDRISDDVYTSYMCNPLEAPHLWNWSS
jgi:hypothetical protein